MAESRTRVVESDLPPPAELGRTERLAPRRAYWLFALGVTAGIVLAALGITRSDRERRPLPAGAIARVGDALVWRNELERTVAALAQDRKTPLTEADRALALQRIVEEELLLQRALELDLPRTDLRARRALISAVVDSVVATQENAEASDAELRRFYEANRAWFTGPDLYRVRQIWFRVDAQEEAPAAEAKAQAAYEKIRAGATFESVREQDGDPESPPLPDSLLTPGKIGELLGPTALRTVMELAAGAVSRPVRSATGYHILTVLERRSGEPPPFEEIRAQVAAEFRRRAADQALRTYLDELRARATIVLAPDAAGLVTPPGGRP
ncbi:MAG: peptidylprolyl isomerase [Candidatus Binatia bacterium]|nr:MAG: peptidylprolyl isomerase [Candidatus Binatia bacterium]